MGCASPLGRVQNQSSQLIGGPCPRGPCIPKPLSFMVARARNHECYTVPTSHWIDL
jgi:hypothetical protein